MRVTFQASSTAYTRGSMEEVDFTEAQLSFMYGVFMEFMSGLESISSLNPYLQCEMFVNDKKYYDRNSGEYEFLK